MGKRNVTTVRAWQQKEGLLLGLPMQFNLTNQFMGCLAYGGITFIWLSCWIGHNYRCFYCTRTLIASLHVDSLVNYCFKH